jgi:hypothetical protein
MPKEAKRLSRKPNFIIIKYYLTIRKGRKSMEKIKNFFRDSLVSILLTSLTIRFITVGGNVGEAIALTALGAVFCYQHFMHKRGEDRYQEVKTELEDRHQDIKRELDDLKGAINAARVAQGLKRDHNIIKSADNIAVANTNDSQKTKRYF